jgi:hypothetical protein
VAATLAVPPVPSDAGGTVESVTERGGGGGPDTDELPPPQPDIVATMLTARRDKFLFTALSEKAKLWASGTSIADPARIGSVGAQRCL